MGKSAARFGYRMLATTSGRLRVTPYRNFKLARHTTWVEALMCSSSTRCTRKPRTSSAPSLSGDRPG